MFSASSARSLRKFFAGYHEPLPLSKAQSQKLLDGLKTSFRTQLDREYGPAPDHPPPASSTKTSSDPDHIGPPRSAAVQHLRSLLSNPLFSYNGPPSSSYLSSPASATPHRDPMDVFDHAVARGLMTFKAATGCILAKRHILSASPSLADMASTDTASRVVRWIRSSGAESDGRFLDHQPFLRALVPFLVAEGLEEVAWEWIARAIEIQTRTPGGEQRSRRASFLLAELARAKSQPRYGELDASIRTLLDAEGRFKNCPLFPDLLVQPWRLVSWLSTVEAYRRRVPSEKLFDAHMATADLFSRPLAVEKAHLHLHHPSCPDDGPALDLLRDRQRVRKLLSRPGPENPASTKQKGMSTVSWIAFLAHDTINHLAQSGRRREADGMTELLRSELSLV